MKRLFILPLVIFAVSTHERSLLRVNVQEGDSVDNGHDCEPQKIRLALTNDQETEMRVSWTTAGPECSSKVHFGSARGINMANNFSDGLLPDFEFVAEVVDSDSYGPSDFCGEPAISDDFSPPHLHSAVLTGLVAGEWYLYKIGHHKPVRQFKSPPARGSDASFTFIAYGDMGESVHRAAKSPGAAMTASRVTQEILEGGAELILHVGDISYSDGEHKIWDAFLDQIEPFASRVPYQIAIGNHEYDWKTGQEKKHHHHPEDASGEDNPYQPDWGNFGNDSGGECGITVSKLFLMPGAKFDELAPSDNHAHHPKPPFWFSYDYGSVHFTTISTEHDLTSGSHQYKWLKEDLVRVDRCETPWLVLLSHRPMYVVHPHKSNRIVGEHLRKSLEHLLEEYTVDLVLSGHVHAYARTCRVIDEQCGSNQGPVHITLGCGGRKLSSVQHTQPEWLEYAEREFGYGRISVAGSQQLTFEYVHSETGKVRDSFTLTNSQSEIVGCRNRDSLESKATATSPVAVS